MESCLKSHGCGGRKAAIHRIDRDRLRGNTIRHHGPRQLVKTKAKPLRDSLKNDGVNLAFGSERLWFLVLGLGVLLPILLG